MDICFICTQQSEVCSCFQRYLNDNDENSVVRLPSDEVLRRPSTIQRLAIVYRNIGLSRRRIIDHVAGVLFETDKIIIDAKGRRVFITDTCVDDAFETDADPSSRWMSSWLQFSDRPPRQALQERILPRFRLLWVALALTNPSLAAKVIQ